MVPSAIAQSSHRKPREACPMIVSQELALRRIFLRPRELILLMAFAFRLQFQAGATLPSAL